MKLLTKLRDATRLFREAFGPLRGTLVWAELLKEKLQPKGGMFCVHVPNVRHPVWLRAGTSDIEVFCQIFVHREIDFYLARNPKYIIDAGANIGMTSTVLANRYPEASIEALEVEQQNIELLKKNASPYPNIKVIEKGLWHRSAHLRIINPGTDSWGFRVGESSPKEAGAIPAISLNDLIDQSGYEVVDLLKIDIEGAEKDVFGNGNTDWIHKVKTLAIELHDRDRPGCSEAVHRVVDPLNPRRTVSGEYNVFWFAEHAKA